MKLLSICIATFNRAGLVEHLVRSVLGMPGSFEICVHVDGSTDDTIQRLSLIDDPRLRVTSDVNCGRAVSLVAAVNNASGRYCMLFDDDDELSDEGLARVLKDCAEPLPEGCVGRIYHLADELGARGGSPFPVARSNLIALRADHAVTGDKKEVVLTEPLRAAMLTDKAYRRVPTSLYWARLALTHDVLCVNEVIGTKTYLAGGMSDSIYRLKRENIHPLILLQEVRLAAFSSRRYRSWRFALRSFIALIIYSVRSLKSSR